MTIKEELKERLERGESRNKAQVEIGKKVKAMLESGYSNVEVANELGITESSVRLIREKYHNK